MNVNKLVTYMKLSDQTTSRQTNIMVSTTDVGIRKFNFYRKDQTFRSLETLVFDKSPANEVEKIIKREEWTTLSKSLEEGHENMVNYYLNNGYQNVMEQDNSNWDSILEGIPNFDSFGSSYAENKVEFFKYLREHQKV